MIVPPVIMEKVLPDGMDKAIKLATEVFSGEQNIPAEMIPLDKALKPVWWCAKSGGDIVCVAAGWVENDIWHWGRFAVEKSLRGLGLGRKMAVFSLNGIFSLGAEVVYIEARDIALKTLKRFGYEIVGEPEDFYGDTITPVIIKRSDFLKAVDSLILSQDC